VKLNSSGIVHDSVAASYNVIASDYASRFRYELDGKPFDRSLLRCFAEFSGNDGAPVIDLGCGTGRVVHYLHTLGIQARGLDISSEMIRQAQQDFPELHFSVASMLALPFGDGSIGGAVSMYSIIHFPVDELEAIFCEIARVIHKNGYLLVVFQTDAETLYVKEAFGKPLTLTYYRHEVATIRTLLEWAGFTARLEAIREPGPAERARQAYLIAQRAN
jgi:ubiquinone/menaquinone biosynthesis C-methylase UbiE